MCECTTKIQFEVSGGNLYRAEPLEKNKCDGFDACFDSLDIDEGLADGVYTADMFCEVVSYATYMGCVEIDGGSALENIKKVRERRKS